MKNFLSISGAAAIGASLLLSGCGPIYQTTYTYKTPKSYRGRMCVNRCLRTKNRCYTMASLTDQNCRLIADNAARPAYRQYIREQKRQGFPIWKKISDFADYSNCHQTQYCNSSYKQCFTNCGGQIIPHTVCTAFCKNAKTQ